ncbi:hypothetical protein DDE20_13730 [Pararhodobacter oceanensis]|uniref:Uncharacterized protein n=1 Tax=Pararhodobacter oceanensis TaxID=2172121 RepID=A0A2T8HRU9_9RHOB|nr:hypothetical protein DDE20_13730 [Pararhodobacter oceanensis]
MRGGFALIPRSAMFDPWSAARGLAMIDPWSPARGLTLRGLSSAVDFGGFGWVSRSVSAP